MLKKIFLCASLLAIAAQASTSEFRETLTELFSAVEEGRTETVKYLLSKNSKIIHEKTTHGLTALSWAAYKGNLELVQELVGAGAEINSETLWSAVENNNLDIVKFFVEQCEAEVDLDALMAAIRSDNPNLGIVSCLLDNLGKNSAIIENEGYNGLTALGWAAYTGNLELVKLLVAKGAKINSRALLVAVKSKTPNRKIVAYLLDKNKDLINDKDNTLETALSLAAKEGKTEIVELLVEKRAKVDIKALAKAVESNSLNLVSDLLNQNPNLINAKDKNKLSVLELALRNRNETLINLVVEKGAEKGGEIFFFNTIRLGQVDAVKYLLERNPELLNARTKQGTALGWAAEKGETKIVELLVEKGAKIDADALLGAIKPYTINHELVKYLLSQNDKIINEKSTDGLTALGWAADKGDFKLVKKLVKDYGAEVNSDALMGAVRAFRPNLGIVRYLLGLCKDPKIINEKSTDEWTPLTWAASKGNQDLFNLLIDQGADVDLEVLVRAVEGDHFGIVQSLLYKNSDIIKNKTVDGRTALSVAANIGDIFLVELLIREGAEVNAEALVGAVRNYTLSKRELVKHLLELCKDSKIINEKASDGWTALSLAANKGVKHLVELFVDKGAKVDIEALVGAVKSDNPNIGIVKYLLGKNSAMINEKASDGWSALSWAAWYGNLELVELLVDRGAMVNDKALFDAINSPKFNLDIVKLLLKQAPDLIGAENEGKTLLQVAEDCGNLELVEFLENFNEE